jgi:ABC-type spermidine/putrescine transport system permease subunit II
MHTFLAILVLLAAMALQLGTALVSARFVLDGFGLPELLALLEDPVTLGALAACVGFALLGGLVVGVAAWRRGAGWLGPALLPLLWPVALRLGPDAPQTAVLACHAALGLGLGALCGTARLSRLSRGVLRAAWMCGVSPLGALRRVMLPVLVPGLLAGVLLAATGSLLLTLLRARPEASVDPALFAGFPAGIWRPVAGAVLVVAVLSGLASWLLRER